MKKYLNDKNWLYQKYIVEQLSSKQISELINCHRTSVIKSLKRYNVNVRSSKESNSILFQNGCTKSKYEVLNDSDKLYDLYVNKKYSLQDIADLYEIKNLNSVRQFLKKFNIEVRNVSDGLTINNDQISIDYEVLYGSLLGDAGLRCYNKLSPNSYACLYKKNKFLDHIKYVAKFFLPNVTDDCIVTEFRMNRKYYKFQTPVDKRLKDEYDRWYPNWNNFKKIVPDGLELTPKILLHWFLDDGTTSWRKQKRSKSVRLTFCSESFSYEDQLYLIDKINSNFQLNAKLIPLKNRGTGYRIKITNKYIERFFEIIGNPPVQSMNYKWKIPIKPLLRENNVNND